MKVSKNMTGTYRVDFTHPEHGGLWSFETRHLRMSMVWEREEFDPAHYPRDEADRIKAELTDGSLRCFRVYVWVFFKDPTEGGEPVFDDLGRRVRRVSETYMGRASLHQCLYASPEQFVRERRDGHFRDLIRDALADARPMFITEYHAMRHRMHSEGDTISTNVWDWEETTMGNLAGKHIETRYRAITGFETEED